MKLQLIPEWRRAWRYFSVLAATALTVLSVLQAEVLPLFQFAVPAERWPWVSASLGALIVVLRLVSQSTPAEPEPPAPSDQPDPLRQSITYRVPGGVDPAAFAEALKRVLVAHGAAVTKGDERGQP